MEITEIANNMSLVMDTSKYSIANGIFTSALYAAGATIFYKKSFERHMLRTLLMVLTSAFVFEQLDADTVRFTVLVAAASVIGISRLKRYSLVTFGTFFLAMLDFKLDVLVSLFNLPVWATFVVNFIVTVPQFIRGKPWKARLQQVRANLGPLYIIYATKTAILINEYDHCIGIMAFVSAFTAALAGTLFRPDNGTLLSLIKPGTTLAQRRTVHRALMLFSLVWWLFSVGWYCLS